MSNVHIRMIEDSSGDLVDLEYFHHGCQSGIPQWPAPEAVDYSVYCRQCGERIEEVPLTDWGVTMARQAAAWRKVKDQPM